MGRRGEGEKGRGSGEAATKEDSPKISKDALLAVGAACLAEIQRRGKAATAPQCESAAQPCDQTPRSMPEGRSWLERREVDSADDRKWPGREKARYDETGQPVATRVEVDLPSKERQPSVSAEFLTQQLRPVVKSRYVVRGRTRWKTSAAAFNRPIFIAAARVRAAAHAGRSRRHGIQLRKGVGAAAGDSG